MWWLRFVEGWMISKLLASPMFHRGVHKIHKTIRQARHGPDLEEMGGTKIEDPTQRGKGFLQHFAEELKESFRPPPKR